MNTKKIYELNSKHVRTCETVPKWETGYSDNSPEGSFIFSREIANALLISYYNSCEFGSQQPNVLEVTTKNLQALLSLAIHASEDISNDTNFQIWSLTEILSIMQLTANAIAESTDKEEDKTLMEFKSQLNDWLHKNS